MLDREIPALQSMQTQFIGYCYTDIEYTNYIYTALLPNNICHVPDA